MSARDYERKIASYGVRKRWERELRGLERRLQGHLVIAAHKGIKEGSPQRHISQMERFNDRDITEDQRQILCDIARRKKALSQQSPVALDRKDRERLARQMAKDKGWLKRNMISRRDNSLSPKHPDFSAAVSKCENEHSDKFNNVANRYKNAMRQLEPDDPNAANIEKLRK